jgi:hypothetical protein
MMPPSCASSTPRVRIRACSVCSPCACAARRACSSTAKAEVSRSTKPEASTPKVLPAGKAAMACAKASVVWRAEGSVSVLGSFIAWHSVAGSRLAVEFCQVADQAVKA